ncbi:MAG TPA: hypothetical protein VGD77_07200 [Gemmatimonadaceae bacterium]
MHPDVAALLAVQTDDADIYTLEDRLQALAPRLEALDRERERAVRGAEQARRALEQEQQRHAALRGTLAEHKALHDKNAAQLDHIANVKQAAAAVMQLEQAKRMLADAEREAEIMGRRIAEMQKDLQEREAAVADVEGRQAETRAAVAAERAAIDAQLEEARGRRDAKARAVPRSLLGRYDRIRSRKREHTVVSLRGDSCSHCDTLLPMQRRNTMGGTGQVEVCEGCGVLLYSP